MNNSLLNPNICPICASRNYKIIFDVSVPRNRLDVSGVIAQCSCCPMMFKIVDDRNKIVEAYSGEYGQGDVSDEYLSGDTTRKFFQQVLKDSNSLPASKNSMLFDMGTGRGTLLEEATKLGFQCQGIDLCQSNVDIGLKKNLKVEFGFAERITYKNAFDVVTMMDIIEHTPDPLSLLKAAYQALKPGGKLIVFTPNHKSAVVLVARALYRIGVAGPVQEIFGSNHVCFFDNDSLPLALNQAGFRIEKVKLNSYDPSRPGQRISLLNVIAVTCIETLGIPFKRVFRMLTYAVKA